MKVCTFKRFRVVVLTRNEHCPPHVHVGANDWEARFQISFLHNGVRLWDVNPGKNRPAVALLEGIRKTIMRSANLRRAREIWWATAKTVCLVNQRWDIVAGDLAMGGGSETKIIRAAWFDPENYRTIVQCGGPDQTWEIKL
jgi:hypothetical protein